MTVWEFDVGVTTHALLARGVPVGWWTLVRVAAPSYLEASCTAIQMAWCSDEERQDHYVTDCRVRI